MLGHMSTQIAVRLPDELVASLDRLVSDGTAASRAELVSSALERHLRHLAALHDAEVLRTRGAEDDLDDLVAWAVGHVSVGD